MENNIVRQAKLVHFSRYHFFDEDEDGEPSWQIPHRERLGIPLSVSSLRSTLPALNDMDSGVRRLLADMLNQNGSWKLWYLLASGSLVRFFADLGFRRLYSIGKPVFTGSEETVTVILVSEHATAPITES